MDGSRSASRIDQKGFGRQSERFEEFRGFQFSETFEKALRKILERIRRFQILKAWLLNAEPLNSKGLAFCYSAVPDLTDN